MVYGYEMHHRCSGTKDTSSGQERVNTCIEDDEDGGKKQGEGGRTNSTASYLLHAKTVLRNAQATILQSRIVLKIIAKFPRMDYDFTDADRRHDDETYCVITKPLHAFTHCK